MLQGEVFFFRMNISLLILRVINLTPEFALVRASHAFPISCSFFGRLFSPNKYQHYETIYNPDVIAVAHFAYNIHCIPSQPLVQQKAVLFGNL